MGRRRAVRGCDARARAVPGCAERRPAAREIAPESAIEYRLFVPSAPRAGGSCPLVVALHGCTQTASDFAAGTRFDSVAEAFGAYVVYPEQSPRANARRCWNWYLPENQSREGGEPADILALVDDIVARFPIDPQKIFVAGLSAGGAMAAILAEQAPDRFAAVGVMAGVPLHASHDLASGYAAMHGNFLAAPRASEHPRGVAAPALAYVRLRATLWAGADDRLVAPANAGTLAHQFLRLIDVDAASGALERRGDAEIERWRDASGRVRVEAWRVLAMGHAWSGGSFRGSHTHPKGPRASEEMMAFFLETSPAEIA